MTADSAQSNARSADIARLLRLLVEAPDQQFFLDRMRALLPRIIADTRFDILRDSIQEGSQVLLTCGDSDAPTPPDRAVSGFVRWLAEQGYGAVSTLPLSGPRQRLGWLVVSRRDGPIDAETLALAGQLAAMASLRLLYDQARDQLASSTGQIALMEQRLRETEEVRMRATLAAGAAHDIGNLFALVMGHVQLMQQQAPLSLQADLRTIEQAANDGSHLLRRLLTARLAAPVSVSVVSLLPAIVHDALRLTQPFWAERPAIAVRSELAPVPPVYGHAAELREVVVNLIMNGIAAMPEGGTLTISTAVVGDRAEVSVRDTGIGIALMHQGAIFQPSVTTREAGSGLGLSVSRAIVESYGGTLTVASAPGEGAVFTLSLPIAHVAEPRVEVPGWRAPL